MPEPAAGATRATVSEWPIAEHTPFPVNAAIAVIETDKAIIEIEAESEGIILRALVPAGTEVDVGAPIALLGSPGEQAGDLDSLLAELGAATSGPSRDTGSP
ncbi:lipoyl domain-containing protein, partial [Sphaerisporangium sp. NPDC049002]|uniref:lipoyl domain-containing protein n=1 Tax=Sphaerisporangium sp. NPDC049002 TaxID=3155392 RepID=UPI0033C9ACF7